MASACASGVVGGWQEVAVGAPHSTAGRRGVTSYC